MSLTSKEGESSKTHSRTSDSVNGDKEGKTFAEFILRKRNGNEGRISKNKIRGEKENKLLNWNIRNKKWKSRSTLRIDYQKLPKVPGICTDSGQWNNRDPTTREKVAGKPHVCSMNIKLIWLNLLILSKRHCAHPVVAHVRMDTRNMANPLIAQSKVLSPRLSLVRKSQVNQAMRLAVLQ